VPEASRPAARLSAVSAAKCVEKLSKRSRSQGGVGAAVADHHAVEQMRQAVARGQVVQGSGREAAHFRALVAGRRQRALAAHGQQVQPVMRVLDDVVLVAAHEFGQHALHHFVDLRLRGPGAGVALAAVQLAQTLESRGGVALAGGGHAPGADRGTDQEAFARRAREPVAEQPLHPLW
jgi:hypothetical protein